MRIARVFPSKTSFSPTDADAYFGPPDMFTPYYDRVNISVTFTWDLDKAARLAHEWYYVAKEVHIGGPAWDMPGEEFTPGMYLRQGVSITSRGCPNKCPFCLVPKREGRLRELEVKPGNVIQDNNILACSPSHLQKVFSMLRGQKQIEFKGGLEAGRLTADICDELASLNIRSLWFACDSPGALSALKKAKLLLNKAGFKRDKLFCYVLIGNDMVENEARLRSVWEAGFMPFAQLFQPEEKINYSREWKQFVRTWSRPAAYKSKMAKEGKW